MRGGLVVKPQLVESRQVEIIVTVCDSYKFVVGDSLLWQAGRFDLLQEIMLTKCNSGSFVSTRGSSLLLKWIPVFWLKSSSSHTAHWNKWPNFRRQLWSSCFSTHFVSRNSIWNFACISRWVFSGQTFYSIIIWPASWLSDHYCLKT